MSDAEFVTCPACGMGWLTRRLCGSCAFKAAPDFLRVLLGPGCAECGGKVVYRLTKAHVEPYPRETAETLAAFTRVLASRQRSGRRRESCSVRDE
jgi:hypothetical protein